MIRFSRGTSSRNSGYWETLIGTAFPVLYPTYSEQEGVAKAFRFNEKGDRAMGMQWMLQYLSDNALGNITWERISKGEIQFELHQGSRRIFGEWNDHGLIAETYIGRVQASGKGALNPPVPLMIELLQRNDSLIYSTLGMKEDGLLVMRLILEPTMLDPWTILDGLQELALQSDVLDDALSGAYKGVEFIHEPHILAWSGDQLSWRKSWFSAQVESLQLIFDPQAEESFVDEEGRLLVFLSAIYKIDAFLNPQNVLKMIVQEVHRSYSARTRSLNRETVMPWIDRLKQIVGYGLDEFGSECYKVTKTFIDKEAFPTFHFPEMAEACVRESRSWRQEGKFQYAKAVIDLFAGWSLHQYDLPAHLRHLMYLILMLNDPGIPGLMGFQSKYFDENGNVIHRKFKKDYLDMVENLFSRSHIRDWLPSGSRSTPLSICENWLSILASHTMAGKKSSLS